MKRESLIEFAALYALDAVDQEDLAWVENALEQDSALARHLQDFQLAAAELAYGVDNAPMSPNLKERLFQRITKGSTHLASQNATFDQPAIADLLEQSKSVKWEPYQPTPSTLLGLLAVDPNTREIQCFVRSWKGVAFPKHRHAGTEEITVLEGDLMIDGRVYHPGDHIISQAGTQHQPKTITGCLLFLKTSLDDEFVDVV